ncbi:MAG: hypothetical protein KGJ55_01680 [Gammaproteobacteria bacterium]|nr:hypothetical protein [Gammaproteobacteria bacterium]
MSADPLVKRSRRRLLLLAALFLAPPVLAVALYFWVPQWIPRERVNHGTLLNPARPLPQLHWIGAPAGSVIGRHWTLLVFGGRRCDAVCLQRVTLIHNLRRVLRGDAQRVSVVYVAPDVATLAAVSPLLAPLNRGVTAVAPSADSQAAYTAFFADPARAPGAVSIVDPLGNWVLSYTPDEPPRPIYLDLKRLLHYSRIG